MAVIRHSLRDQALEMIEEMIDSGTLVPGSRINESRISEQIGVSRTPLREALHTLERDGLITKEPGRGFFVAAVSAETVSEIYPLIGGLEGLALRWAIDPARAPELDEINDAMLEAGPKGWRALDERFHFALIRGHGNKRLDGMLAELKRLARIYEQAYVRSVVSIEESAEQHRMIIRAIASGDVAAAVAALEHNWTSTIETLRKRLEDDDVTSPAA